MNMVLKVAGTLADSTRYSIYEYILKGHSEVTVQSIAAEFNIHPNVARLHLTKLEDVKLIESVLRKTGKGGRPGKVYKAAEKSVQLSFPHRDYQLLSELLLDAIQLFGEDGVKMAEAAAEKAGQRAVEAETGKMLASLSKEERIQLLRTMAARIGFTLEIMEEYRKIIVRFVIYNCPFKELLHEKAAITCRIHKAFLQGVMHVIFEAAMLDQKTTMLDGCGDCTYHAIVTN